MKLINYRCSCGYEIEEFFSSKTRIPQTLKQLCPCCKGELKQFNFKNNSQRVFIYDPQRKD